jgi:hypothetical protein
MNCRNKYFVISFCGLFGLFLSSALPAHAQSNVYELDDVDVNNEADMFEENTSDDVSSRLAPYFGAPSVPVIHRDQATGNPISITPGPYLSPGTVLEDPFREEPAEVPVQSFYEDGNVFASEDMSNQYGNVDDSNLEFELGITTGRLAEIDPATLGLFEERSGGLPYNMWDGSSYDRVVNLISILPVATPSSTMNKMSEQLLLSSASVPSRQSAKPQLSEYNENFDGGIYSYSQTEAVPEFNNNELLLARLLRISQTGKMKIFSDFMNILPQSISIPELRELRINTALLRGDTMSACNLAQDARAEDGATYWLKILTYCRAVDGDRAGVGFNVSMLQETNEAPLYFVSLIEDVLALSEGRLRGASVVQSIEAGDMTSLNMAMVNTVKAELPLHILKDIPRLFLSSMTRRADLSIDFRAEVSELAALYGVMDGRVFSEVLEVMNFTDGERDSIFLLANTDLGARVDGLLINSAMVEGDRLRKAELISTAFERSLRNKLHPALSYPLLDVVKTITPAPDLAFFAHDAGRIAIYSGDGLTAKKWYNLVLGMASAENFEASRSLVSLWPLMLMNDQTRTIPANAEILNLWQQSLSQLPNQDQRQRIDLLYALLDVFSYDVQSQPWDMAYENAASNISSKMPNHAVWRDFLYSARAGRVGETLALGLLVLGDGMVSEVNISVLTSVLSVFKAMGLEAEARAIAIEAMVGSGF